MFRRKKTTRKDISVNNPSIYEESAKFVGKVLREGADPNFISENNNEGRLPALSYAVYYEYYEVRDIFVVFLNDPRTDVNKESANRRSPLIHVCDSFVSDEVGVELIALLLKHSQIEINKKDDSGLTALSLACMVGKNKCVRALVNDERTDINTIDMSGFTPLHEAVLFGDVEIVKVLLTSTSIDPNIAARGQTPLHLAHWNGLKEIMKELLKDKRIRIDIPDGKGRTVAELITDPALLEYFKGPRCYKDIYCI